MDGEEILELSLDTFLTVTRYENAIYIIDIDYTLQCDT